MMPSVILIVQSGGKRPRNLITVLPLDYNNSGDQLVIVTLSAETQTNIIWQETTKLPGH